MNRHYVPAAFKVTTWELLKPFYNELLTRELSSEDKLERWLHDVSELSSVVSEDMAWRYIKMTCDTTSEELRNSFNDFVTNIEPNIAPIANDLNKKLVDCKFTKDLPKEKFFVYFKRVSEKLECIFLRFVA